MSKPTIGLLPLYLALYDRVAAEARPRVEAFVQTIADEFEKRGVGVYAAPVCRVKEEFESAVESFENTPVDAIVTLHLAYSPSLESAEVLATTDLPVFVLDTSPTYEFGPDQNPDEIMFNHGIHGVQDLCNLLIRLGKPFQIEAGHWEKSDVIERTIAWVRAARLASAMRSARIGRIGEPFQGMGDFSVPDEVLAAMGVQVVPCDFDLLKSLVPGEADVDLLEMQDNSQRFKVEADEQSLARTVRACLAVRRWMEREKLSGFTMNFDAIDASTGLPTVPFLEASKAMARGKGYAGEGDVLTAALVGALASVFPETTFTEMFCADWAGGTVFLSHMGEMNPTVAAGAPVLMTRDLPFLKTDPPAIAIGRLRAGEAVYVNLAPGPQNSFTLIVAPVQMLDEGEDRMPETVRGWFRPAMPVADFLEAYSRLGGTHHSAMVYGDVVDDLARFGELMGWDVAVLG